MRSWGQQDLVRTVLDTDEPVLERVIAARRLGEIGSDLALDTLLQIARVEDVDGCLAFAAGEGVADILLERGSLDRADLHSFNGPAYLGYDECIARHQRRRRRPATGG